MRLAGILSAPPVLMPHRSAPLLHSAMLFSRLRPVGAQTAPRPASRGTAFQLSLAPSPSLPMPRSFRLSPLQNDKRACPPGACSSPARLPLRHSASVQPYSLSRPLLSFPHAAVAAPADAEPVQVTQTALPWQWHPQREGAPASIPIHAVSFSISSSPASADPSSPPPPTLLLLPALSDVATVEEWLPVGSLLLSLPLPLPQPPKILSLDWPGFGASGCPPLLYTVDMLEDFLTAYVAHIAADGAGPLVIVGGGHAATIALRCAAEGRIAPAAVVAVAPTWGGPLPIVFGNDEKMAFRYGLLRNTIRTPVLGSALYSYLTSESQIKMQYMTHVYGDADNVSSTLVAKRTAITKREGGRFAPSSFLTGLLDPVKSREEFLGLFGAAAGRGVPVAVLASGQSPKRSRREMESLQGAPGVAMYETVRGALLPYEEYPEDVALALERFLDLPEVNDRLQKQ